MELGIQAYSLRKYTYEETLQKSEAMGIQYMEIYPGQKIGGGIEGMIGHKADAATREKILALAKEHHVTLVSYGVVEGHNDDEWHQIFEFAKALDLYSINCQAGPEELSHVVELAKPYGIRVALHNHPGIPGIIQATNPYWDPHVAYDALKDRGPEVGICADTGHWVGSGFDPVWALHLLRGHIVELHYKDKDMGGPRGHCVPFGTGVSNAAGQLAELRKQGFKGYVLIEYETEEPQLLDNIKRCVDFYRGAMKAPVEDLIDGKYLPVGYTADVETQIHNPEAMKSGLWPAAQSLLAEDLANTVSAPAGTWGFNQGILKNSGTGTLRTKDRFEEFSLSFEFACVDATRARIHMKSAAWSGGRDISVVIAGGAPDKDEETTGTVLVGCGNASEPATCIGATRPLQMNAGTWNTLEVSFKKDGVEVYLNREMMAKVTAAIVAQREAQAEKTAGKVGGTVGVAGAAAPVAGDKGAQVDAGNGTPIEICADAAEVQIRSMKIDQ
jgi:sugar phosphate isomerase/epimerase